MNRMFRIVEDDLQSAPTQALLTLHLRGMQATSPPGAVFALDLSGLTAANVTVWSVHEGDDLLGIGALKQLSGAIGEIKSMRTHPAHVGGGVGTALLEHIIRVAQARGLIRLSLETGSGPAFEPALALYRRRGFVDGDPVGDYERTDFNRFLHLAI